MFLNARIGWLSRFLKFLASKFFHIAVLSIEGASRMRQAVKGWDHSASTPLG